MRGGVCSSNFGMRHAIICLIILQVACVTQVDPSARHVTQSLELVLVYVV